MGFLAGDANLYRYVGNNPTNMTDPDGLQAQAVDGPTPEDVKESALLDLFPYAYGRRIKVNTKHDLEIGNVNTDLEKEWKFYYPLFRQDPGFYVVGVRKTSAVFKGKVISSSMKMEVWRGQEGLLDPDTKQASFTNILPVRTMVGGRLVQQTTEITIRDPKDGKDYRVVYNVFTAKTGKGGSTTVTLFQQQGTLKGASACCHSASLGLIGAVHLQGSTYMVPTETMEKVLDTSYTRIDVRTPADIKNNDLIVFRGHLTYEEDGKVQTASRVLHSMRVRYIDP